MKCFGIIVSMLLGQPALADLSECMCQKNPVDCNVGKLICDGKIDGSLQTTFSEVEFFGPDDDNTPVAGIRLRNYTQPPKVTDLHFFANSCDGLNGTLNVSFFIWENTAPNYPILEKETMSLSIQQNSPAHFSLKADGKHVSGKCFWEKLGETGTFPSKGPREEIQPIWRDRKLNPMETPI